MCKLTKTDSPLLSWCLEAAYVGEVMARDAARPPTVGALGPDARVYRSEED